MPATPSVTLNCVMGFDFGKRRIGVAVGNPISGSASALGVVANGESGPDWTRIESYFREWRPDLLLVGLPLTEAGAEQATSHAARAFALALGQHCPRPVQLVDERYTSIAAGRRFAEQRSRGAARRKDQQQLDAMAAAIIVEQWLATPAATSLADADRP